MAMQLFIRADGNGQIGAGHLMRCLSVADAAKGISIQAHFILADGGGRRLVEERGYRASLLGTDYRRMEEELPVLKEFLAGQEERSFLLIDSYYATPAYLEGLRGCAGTAYFDDFGEKAYPADLIINYNIYAEALPYQVLYGRQEEREGRGIKLLLGSRYAPLRRRFREAVHEPRERAQDILITTGGADRFNVAGRLAERLLARWEGRSESPRLHIVSGPFHGFREELYALSKRCPQVVIHENVADMADLMAGCDLAASAAGSTLYELCAVGVPAVYFYFVENQELPARYFARATCMVNAGNYACGAEETLEALVRETERLAASPGYREEVAGSMKAVTDARGAERIAESIRQAMDMEEERQEKG